MEGYKLFRLRKDNTLAPLFINRTQTIPIGKWLHAEDHPTKGYAHRPGWHVTSEPIAPHLSTKGRIWARVKIQKYKKLNRPNLQGGTWFIAQKMKVLEIIDETLLCQK